MGIGITVRSASQRAQKGEILVSADLTAYRGLTTRGFFKDPSTTVFALAASRSDQGGISTQGMRAVSSWVGCGVTLLRSAGGLRVGRGTPLAVGGWRG